MARVTVSRVVPVPCPSRARGARLGIGRLAALAAAALTLGGRAGEAQGFDDSRRLALESGAAVLRQVGAPDLIAPTIGVDWRGMAGSRAALRLGGNATIAEEGRWAAQLVGGATRYVGRNGEVGAQVAAVRFQSAPLTTQAQAVARRHVVTGDALRATGLWAGLSAGGTAQNLRARPMAGLETGVWHSWRPEVRLGLTFSALAAMLDSSVSSNAGFVLSQSSSRFGALDAVASAEWRAQRLELSAYAGLRHARDVTPPGGGATPRRLRPLTFASATFWAVPTLGFVASAGEQFADPVRGVPAVRHFALAVRVRARASRRIAPPPLPPEAAATREAPRLVLGGAGGPARMRVLAPGAARVSLRADATGWSAIELVAVGDGAWELPLDVAAGTHRVMIRVDEGAWITPANLPTIDDEFGSRVGLLVVP